MKSEQLHRPIKLLRPTNWFFSLRQNNITDWNNSGVHSFLRFTQFRCFLEMQHKCVLFYIAICIQIIRGVTRIFQKGESHCVRQRVLIMPWFTQCDKKGLQRGVTGTPWPSPSYTLEYLGSKFKRSALPLECPRLTWRGAFHEYFQF